MRRMILISIAAALVVAPTVGEAASAKRGKACPDGTVCVWSKKNFRGEREVIDKKGATNLSRELNNNVSSVKDRSNSSVYLMDAKNGSTDDNYQCMFEPEYRDLSEIDWNNVTTSVLRSRPGDPKIVC